MLELLKIKNIAIIDSAEIPFQKGLNILSGETGAGKSIILEAISLLLGCRANLDLIRAECDEGVVEGVFNISDIPWIRERLKSKGFSDISDELIIKRSVNRSGKHRISINGELANLHALQGVCMGLIDLCGQNEHQSLLQPSTQLELIDRYGELTEKAAEIRTLWQEISELRNDLKRLQDAQLERNQRRSFLKFQTEEIEAANLLAGEEEDLQKEKLLLQSAHHRVQTAAAALPLLDQEDEGALHLLRTALLKLRALSQVDARTQNLVESMERSLAEAEETAMSLQRYIDTVGGELDSEKLALVQERLSLIADLRRKYGKTTGEILEYHQKILNESLALGDTDERIQALLAELPSQEETLLKEAKRLHKQRKKASELLSDSVTQELRDLKMGEARFQIELSYSSDFSTWTLMGADTVQFQVRTNHGEPSRALGRIASGGELSRLMLAIRRVIADRGGIGVYLFDEIDAGIGGQTAFQVGKKLASVATYNQVICITHLPQVAAFADHHLVVQKTVHGKRTLTEIQPLKKPQRKEEIARMLGGPQLTRKSVENASELLKMAHR
ncbi:MAG: DNA repair protein RecN [Bdellovibrio sp.]|nr:DNA repair protein RecN [Bdellovibrio sp.]